MFSQFLGWLLCGPRCQELTGDVQGGPLNGHEHCLRRLHVLPISSPLLTPLNLVREVGCSADGKGPNLGENLGSKVTTGI